MSNSNLSKRLTSNSLDHLIPAMRHFSLILLQNFQARHQIHAIIQLIIDIVIIIGS
jgi:hypothetical protein